MVKIRESDPRKSRPNLPATFYRKYFRKNQQDVKLQFEKKSWPTTIIYNPTKKNTFISHVSNIEVHIFDMTCLEIDYPSMDHISDDDSIEILNELLPRGWPRKTEKAALKTPSASTSKMFTSSAKTEVVKWCPKIDYPSKDYIDDDNMVKVENGPPRRGRGRPRKTEKAAPNTPSPCTSKMFTSSAKTKVKWCPEIDYPSKDHINDDNMVKVENEPPRRGRGRPRKTEKAAPKTPSACALLYK
nr:uncharacterized protein LOC112783430 isoform X2 [Arachis hypogaea]